MILTDIVGKLWNGTKKTLKKINNLAENTSIYVENTILGSYIGAGACFLFFNPKGLPSILSYIKEGTAIVIPQNTETTILGIVQGIMGASIGGFIGFYCTKKQKENQLYSHRNEKVKPLAEPDFSDSLRDKLFECKKIEKELIKYDSYYSDEKIEKNFDEIKKELFEENSFKSENDYLYHLYKIYLDRGIETTSKNDNILEENKDGLPYKQPLLAKH